MLSGWLGTWAAVINPSGLADFDVTVTQRAVSNLRQLMSHVAPVSAAASRGKWPAAWVLMFQTCQ